MKTEEIKSLKLAAQTFEVRTGRALTTIELLNNTGKPTGRDLVFRNGTEFDDLVSALIQARDWLKVTFNDKKPEVKEEQ